MHLYLLLHRPSMDKRRWMDGRAICGDFSALESKVSISGQKFYSFRYLEKLKIYKQSIGEAEWMLAIDDIECCLLIWLPHPLFCLFLEISLLQFIHITFSFLWVLIEHWSGLLPAEGWAHCFSGFTPNK